MPVLRTGIFLFYVLSCSAAIDRLLRRTLVRPGTLFAKKKHFPCNHCPLFIASWNLGGQGVNFVAQHIPHFGKLFFFKGCFGHQEKRGGIKVEMKKMWRFQVITHCFPAPLAAAPLISQRKAGLFEVHGKMVAEGSGPAVNHAGQYKPKRKHEYDPKKRTDEKSKRQYFFKIKQTGRQQGKYIHQDNHEPDFLPA